MVMHMRVWIAQSYTKLQFAIIIDRIHRKRNISNVIVNNQRSIHLYTNEN